MLKTAIVDHDLDPERCVMIGDKQSDINAASAAGLGKRILASSGQARLPAELSSADMTWRSLQEATRAISEVRPKPISKQSWVNCEKTCC